MHPYTLQDPMCGLVFDPGKAAVEPQFAQTVSSILLFPGNRLLQFVNFVMVVLLNPLLRTCMQVGFARHLGLSRCNRQGILT